MNVIESEMDVIISYEFNHFLLQYIGRNTVYLMFLMRIDRTCCSVMKKPKIARIAIHQVINNYIFISSFPTDSISSEAVESVKCAVSGSGEGVYKTLFRIDQSFT